jgi:DNA-binding transcriptional LysR family regulator
MSRPRLRRYFRHGFLPQLIAFEACVRLGGVTRAAEELSLAQPTVSCLLRRLSETVGEPVLRCRGGSVELTDAGLDVALLCEEVLASLSRFDERRRQRAADRPAPALREEKGELPVS